MAIYRGEGGAGDATSDISINQVTTLTASAGTSASNALLSANSATASASAAAADKVLTSADVVLTGADIAFTNADVVSTNADVVLTAADVATTQETEWDTTAIKMTAASYATEAEDAFVKSYASDGDGTFTATDTTDYSALHHTAKAEAVDLTGHVSSTSNPHSVTKAQVGLGSCDDTSDADKPVSTAQQTALDLKSTVITTATKVDITAVVAAASQSWSGVTYTDPDAIGTSPTANLYPDGSIVGSTSNGRYTKWPNGVLQMLMFRGTGTTVTLTFPIEITSITEFSFSVTNSNADAVVGSWGYYNESTSSLVSRCTRSDIQGPAQIIGRYK